MILYICFYKYDFIHDYTYVWLHNDYIHIWIKKYIIIYYHTLCIPTKSHHQKPPTGVTYPNSSTFPTNNTLHHYPVTLQSHLVAVKVWQRVTKVRCTLELKKNWQTNTWTSNVKHDSKHTGKILDKVLVCPGFQTYWTWIQSPGCVSSKDFHMFCQHFLA